MHVLCQLLLQIQLGSPEAKLRIQALIHIWIFIELLIQTKTFDPIITDNIAYTKNPYYEFVITMVLLQVIARMRKHLILRQDQKLLLFVNITQPCIWMKSP